MSGSDYFVGQVADLLGSGKKKKKNVEKGNSQNKLAELFNVKASNTPNSSGKKKTKPPKPQEVLKSSSDGVLNAKKRKQKNKNKPSEEKKTIVAKKENKNAESSSQDTKSTDMKTKEKKKKKKKKNQDVKKEDNAEKQAEIDTVVSEKKKGFDPPKGIIHESLVKKKDKKSGKRKRDEESDDEEEETKAKTRKRHKRDKTKDRRTVFVGNIPIDCKKTEVKTLFAQFGKIESLRYRCPPVSDPKISKKVTMIKKDFHPDRSNIVSFICFEESEAAIKSLKLNGHEMNGFHLRVDLASNEKKHNKANSVFVGNLPYDIEENDIWNHFEPCGVVENVRIVRDRKTGLGKGFGYVLFEDRSSIDLAMKLHCSRLKQREIRVDKCGDSQKMKTPKPARQRLVKKAKKLGLKPTNMRPGEKRKPKAFKKDKHKKSRTKDSVDKAFSSPKPVSTTGNSKHIKFD